MAEQQRPKGETDNCRSRLLKYCQGQGLDLGCGNAKIKPDAIGIDPHSPIADMNRDARLLDYYPSEYFDYVYSSHLLEELENTEPILREWLRVIKPGGFLVLYQADKDLYFPIGHPSCNPIHKQHFDWKSLWAILEGIGGVTFIIGGTHPETTEWSFELVVRKGVQEKTPEAPKVDVPVTLEGVSILVPTLNRPQSIEDFSTAVNNTARNPSSVEIVFGIHEEDQASKEKIVELAGKLKIGMRAEVIQRYSDGKTHLAFLWNQLYPLAKYSILGYFGDDVLFKTPGWDEEVQKEFAADKSLLIACNDVHIQKGRTATLFFTHKNSHEKLGFYLKPEFRRWYMDTFLDVIFRNAGKLRYREDIITEHMHPDVFPERMDDTYRALGGHTAPGGLKDQDKALWLSENNRAELKRCVEILKG